MQFHFFLIFASEFIDDPESTKLFSGSPAPPDDDPIGPRRASLEAEIAIESHDQPAAQNSAKNAAGGAMSERRSLAVWIATAGGLGHAPIAPGTFGSALGVLLFVPLTYLGWELYLLTLVTLSCLGVWAADRAESYFGEKDDGRIVIDEVAGQLWTLLPLVFLTPLTLLGIRPLDNNSSDTGFFVWIVLVVTAFVVFRVLDIWKPGPVVWAERNFAGGLGVMADDIVAGMIGAVVITVPSYASVLFQLHELEIAGLVTVLGGAIV